MEKSSQNKEQFLAKLIAIEESRRLKYPKAIEKGVRNLPESFRHTPMDQYQIDRKMDMLSSIQCQILSLEEQVGEDSENSMHDQSQNSPQQASAYMDLKLKLEAAKIKKEQLLIERNYLSERQQSLSKSISIILEQINEAEDRGQQNQTDHSKTDELECFKEYVGKYFDIEKDVDAENIVRRAQETKENVRTSCVKLMNLLAVRAMELDKEIGFLKDRLAEQPSSSESKANLRESELILTGLCEQCNEAKLALSKKNLKVLQLKNMTGDLFDRDFDYPEIQAEVEKRVKMYMAREDQELQKIKRGIQKMIRLIKLTLEESVEEQAQTILERNQISLA